MPRKLCEIANEIRRDWERPYFGAVPYINAMATLNTITDRYGAEDAQGIVVYFLSNARNWRGDTAKRIKAELKLMANIK